MEILICIVLGTLLFLVAMIVTMKMDKLIAKHEEVPIAKHEEVPIAKHEEVPIKFLGENAAVPRYMTKDSAAVDLVAQECITIQPGKRTVIATGLSGAIPRGHAGLVCSRSGIALKHGVVVANAPGVIDPDYRGEWKVILANLSDWPFQVKAGNRIAQLIIVPVRRCQFVEVSKLDDTKRGQGGFGSTGE